MLSLMKRREVQALLRQGRSQSDVAGTSGISLSSVKRIAKEPDVKHLDDAAERRRRRIGRPSPVRAFRDLVVELLSREPDMRANEVLRRVRLRGYAGGRSALYALVAQVASDRGASAASPRRCAGGAGV